MSTTSAARVVGEHLAHRVAQHDAHVPGHGARRAAPRIARPRARRELRHLVEALRMARHDDEQDLRGQPCRAKRVEQQRLLALARAARDPHRARLRRSARRSCAARSSVAGGHLQVELHVAGHGDRGARRARRSGARRPRSARRCRPGSTKRPARERGEARVARAPSAPTGARWRAPPARPRARTPRAGAARARSRGSRPARDGSGATKRRVAKPEVVRQPGALDAVAEELLAGGAARGRHVREQDAVAGMARRAAPRRSAPPRASRPRTRHGSRCAAPRRAGA